MIDSSQKPLTLFAETQIPLKWGEFTLSLYRDEKNEDIVVLSRGELPPKADSVFVRVHSECFTGEVLGSLKCDCKDQLDLALEEIAKRESGVVIYLRQEGRGIGLGEKIKAYALQSTGLDTIEANVALGLPIDNRTFELAGRVLNALNVHKIELNTNNPQKMKDLEESGIQIVKLIPSLGHTTPHNEAYLQTKSQKMGHWHLESVLKSRS